MILELNVISCQTQLRLGEVQLRLFWGFGNILVKKDGLKSWSKKIGGHPHF